MESNTKKILLCILSFLIPIVGWILYFVKKSEEPENAKSYGIAGLAGFALNLIITCAGNM